MYSSDPLPIRVLVKGASTVTWISWMGGPRTDFAFPRALEAELIAQGRQAEVRNTAVLGTPTKSFFEPFERDVVQWSPDVIVVVAGHYESIHLFLPRWFERHANRLNYRPGRFDDFYRRRVIRPIWKALAVLQSKLDTRFGLGACKRRMRRAAKDLENYIKLVQQVGSPLMLVFELVPPAPRQQEWFPGMAGRIARVNEEHAAVIERLGLPHVRMYENSQVVAQMYGDDQAAATPDGFHFTPELHRAIGAALAEQIAEWAETQPHLATGHASQPHLAPARDNAG
jgi:lysophospholipase L1-like esterase